MNMANRSFLTTCFLPRASISFPCGYMQMSPCWLPVVAEGINLSFPVREHADESLLSPQVQNRRYRKLKPNEIKGTNRGNYLLGTWEQALTSDKGQTCAVWRQKVWPCQIAHMREYVPLFFYQELNSTLWTVFLKHCSIYSVNTEYKVQSTNGAKFLRYTVSTWLWAWSNSIIHLPSHNRLHLLKWCYDQ